MSVTLEGGIALPIIASVGTASKDTPTVGETTDPIAAANKAKVKAQFEGGDGVCRFEAYQHHSSDTFYVLRDDNK